MANSEILQFDERFGPEAPFEDTERFSKTQITPITLFARLNQLSF